MSAKSRRSFEDQVPNCFQSMSFVIFAAFMAAPVYQIFILCLHCDVFALTVLLLLLRANKEGKKLMPPNKTFPTWQNCQIASQSNQTRLPKGIIFSWSIWRRGKEKQPEVNLFPTLQTWFARQHILRYWYDSPASLWQEKKSTPTTRQLLSLVEHNRSLSST